jgi:hypothetical protein
VQRDDQQGDTVLLRQSAKRHPCSHSQPIAGQGRQDRAYEKQPTLSSGRPLPQHRASLRAR